MEVDLELAEETYTALSYVWGHSQYGEKLVLDDAILPITTNLHKALRHLRSSTTVKKLWVDAVCINQSDVVERSNQVPLMTRIYQQAETVHSWLGEETPLSPIGMEILSFLATDQPFDDGSPWNRLIARQVADGLEDILERSYFKRMWVVQEAALGRRIKMQVGNISLEWGGEGDTRQFLARIKLLEISPTWQTDALKDIDLRPIRELLEQSAAHMDKQAGRSQVPTFLDLVHAMRHRESSDPRDSIYGVMRLVSPAEVADFAVDYNASWEETYRKFFHHVQRTALQNPSQEWRRD